jgi:hypothetical protein
MPGLWAGAEVVRIEGQAWMADTPLARHDRLRVGTTVKTGAASRLLLRFKNGDQMALGPQSRLTLQPQKIIEHHRGEAFFRSAAQKVRSLSDRSFQIRTPTAVIGIRGTEFIVDVAQKEAILLREGALHLTPKSGRFELYKEQAAEGVAQKKRAFEAYRTQMQKAFRAHKAEVQYAFEAYVQSVSLKPMRRISLEGGRAYEGALAKEELARFEAFDAFLQGR